MNVFLIVVGGFFGAMSRYAISQWVKNKYASSFPVSTLIVNLAGSFLLGWLIGSGIGANWKSLLGTGFMGAFTTFSTFKLDTVKLFEKKLNRTAVLYLAVSYLGGILLAFCGLAIGQF
ncbi:MAG TPA: fluoride efflux transporter CrcB [Bacillales bacterium]|nr:fluoride efflux transporter CrcB [Bacillales bacterium]